MKKRTLNTEKKIKKKIILKNAMELGITICYYKFIISLWLVCI